MKRKHIRKILGVAGVTAMLVMGTSAGSLASGTELALPTAQEGAEIPPEGEERPGEVPGSGTGEPGKDVLPEGGNKPGTETPPEGGNEPGEDPGSGTGEPEGGNEPGTETSPEAPQLSEGPQPTEGPQPSEGPSPSETPQPSEEPQPPEENREVTVTWKMGEEGISPGADFTWAAEGLTLRAEASEGFRDFTIQIVKDGRVTEITGSDTDQAACELRETGLYQVTLFTADEDKTILGNQISFTIRKEIRELIWMGPSEEAYPYAGKAVPLPTAGLKGEGEELQNVRIECKNEKGEIVPEARDAGKYTVTASLTGEQMNHYRLAQEAEVQKTFEITRLPIEIRAAEGQSKYYGGPEPARFGYTVVSQGNADLGPEAILRELALEYGIGPDQLLYREDPAGNQDAGAYELKLNLGEEGKGSRNFAIIYRGAAFQIQKLPVILIPEEEQGKLYGQRDPENFAYSVVLGVEQEKTSVTAAELREELGNLAIRREAGEKPGSYRYIPVPGSGGTKIKGENLDLKLSEKAPCFTVRRLQITEVEPINSRQESFRVTTNLKGDRTKKAETRIQAEVLSFPKEKDGISFNREAIRENLAKGTPFTGSAGKGIIGSVVYEKDRRDMDGQIYWTGYLPAGTKLRISIVDGDGETVSANHKDLTVSPLPVELRWSGYESGAAGNFVTDGAGEALTVKATSGPLEKEWLEIAYQKEENSGARMYYEEGLDYSFFPEARNFGEAHLPQWVTASVLDTLNLECQEKTLQFYVDDRAFDIPPSAIRFENRGKEIAIQLPEYGTISEVSITGGEVRLPGGWAREFVLPVSWSGEELIPTGAQITVTYKDLAGHQGVGRAAAAQSFVVTPITFAIRPELNSNGYLNGRSSVLIVSGTACACEPIRVSVADMAQTTNATQTQAWSDSNGSWEALFPMSQLPEGQDFTIQAEYMDVRGEGYSINARFDAFCASPAVVSPIFEAMTHISGMVEAGTAVALVVNGETKNYYELPVDRFGRFSFDETPMMFGGEDFFDIYVTDVAGNVSIRHYEIPEPGDPFQVSGQISPLGKLFYSPQERESRVFGATPVSAGDFTQDTVEIPLLMGMSYEVGALTLHRTEKGFTVSSRLEAAKGLDPEDYTLSEGALYVYTGKPTVEELQKKAGTRYAYGEEIPLGEGTIWIAGGQELTISGEDMEALKLYDYEKSREYVRYQEQ